MSYEIEFERKAFQELKKLEGILSRRILRKIKELSINPFSKNVKRLRGKIAFRLRVGDYRVIFYIDNNLIKILKIGHRKNIYER